MKELVKAALSYRMGAAENNNTHKKGTLVACWQGLNYPPEAYATDDVIAEALVHIINFKQSETMFIVL